MSLVNAAYRDLVVEVFDCFQHTEKLIKKFEKDHAELSIPSINELRYVGYHFGSASAAQSDVSIREEIKKALNHCKRAKFDTYEASTTLILERLKEFNDIYSQIVETQEVLTDYVVDLSRIQQISDELQDIISTKYDTREEYYEAIGKNHDELKKILQKFELAKPQIEVKVSANNIKKKNDTRKFITTVSLSALGIIVLATIRLGLWRVEEHNETPAALMAEQKKHIKDEHQSSLDKSVSISDKGNSQAK